MQVGASAIVRRVEATDDRLSEAIRVAAVGDGSLPARPGDPPAAPGRRRTGTTAAASQPDTGLSHRELRILRLLADGLSTIEIAREMAVFGAHHQAGSARDDDRLKLAQPVPRRRLRRAQGPHLASWDWSPWDWSAVGFTEGVADPQRNATPADVEEVLDEFAHSLQGLGALGLYLGGSAAAGTYEPALSDLDLVAVRRRRDRRRGLRLSKRSTGG